MACWAMGRLLGHSSWATAAGTRRTGGGLSTPDQVGKRLPAAIFQALEGFAVFLLLIAINGASTIGPTARAASAIRRASSSAPG